MMIFRAFVNAVSGIECIVQGYLREIYFQLCILLEYYAPRWKIMTKNGYMLQ